MKLAVFSKNFSNPAYVAARLGAERAAAALGAEVRHFVPQKGDDPGQQAELIDAALAQDFDAFVISPVHPHKVDHAFARIHAAGVPVASFVNPIAAVPCVAHVGADDAALGRAIARVLFERLAGRGRVLVVGGHAHSVTSRDRVAGFAQVAQEFPDIRLSEPLAGDYDRDTACRVAGAWLNDHDGVDACLVANDIMAIGVLEALDQRGLRLPVVGVNAIPEAIAAIRQGRMLASADFNALRMAYLATECAIRHLKGERVPAHIELPVDIVDVANCHRWDQPYEVRSVLSLADLAP